jgi:hypothetical protein
MDSLKDPALRISLALCGCGPEFLEDQPCRAVHEVAVR